jgi:exonuclease SbcD
MGKSRQAEHQKFLDWLIEQTKVHRIEALIVAGDIFDTGAPPSYARELYHKFVIQFCTSTNNSVPLVFIAGNHDSVAMLEETSELLKHFNAHVISFANSETYENQTLFVNNINGELKGIICAIPFLRARDLISSTSGRSGSDKQRDLQAAIEAHYKDLYEHADEIRIKSACDIPIVMTGHLTVVGAKTSESVRDIYIGSLDAFSASSFPPAEYIALGHIHKPQKIKSAQEVYYSGSPIPLSFDELNQPKSVQLVDIKVGNVDVKRLDIPMFQAMHKVKGDLSEISMEIDSLKRRYSDLASDSSSHESVWVEVEVDEQDYLEDLQKRVEELVADSFIEVLCLKRSRKRRNLSLSGENTERLQELTPLQVFDKRLALEKDSIDEQLQIRLKEKFNDALNQVEQEGLN